MKSNIVIINSSDKLPNQYSKECWKESTKFNSRDKIYVEKNGRQFRIVDKKTRSYNFFIARVLAGTLISILSFGIAPLALRSVRNLFKRSVSIRFAVPISILNPSPPRLGTELKAPAEVRVPTRVDARSRRRFAGDRFERTGLQPGRIRVPTGRSQFVPVRTSR